MKRYNRKNKILSLLSIIFMMSTAVAAVSGFLSASFHDSPMWISLLLMFIVGIIPTVFYKLATRDLIARIKIDSTTGLLTREIFNEQFKKVLAESNEAKRQFHLLILDLNKFRKINDTFGHAVGNQLLSYVGLVLLGAVKPGDIVARLGSDEFAIILMDPLKASVYNEVIDNITQRLQSPFKVNNHEIYVSTSIGVATFPESAVTTDKLMRAADVAMFSAKNTHADYIVFNQATDEERKVIGDIAANELRLALDHNQFELWYQPKRNTATNKVSSVECLVRWNHPIRGIVGPDTFVPALETAGLIKYLTQFVVKEATHTYQRLIALNYDFTLAINISPNDIVDPATMTTIIKSIVKADMPPSRLVLEVTETAIMIDPDASFKILIALESLGIKLSIDDFGVGHSSLSYLKNFPIYEIKIDRSFIKDIDTSKEGLNIVKSIIELAHNLNAVTVAEGVENKTIEDTVIDLGCDYIQGYYLAKPMTFDDLLHWLQTTQPWPNTEK